MNRGFIPRFKLMATEKNKAVVSSTLLDYTGFDEAMDKLGAGVFDKGDKTEVKRMAQSIIADLGKIDQGNIPQQAAVVLKKRLTAICEAAYIRFEEAKVRRIEGLLAIRRHRHLLPLMDDWPAWRRGAGGKSNS